MYLKKSLFQFFVLQKKLKKNYLKISEYTVFTMSSVCSGWGAWGPEDQDSIIIDGFNVAFCTDGSQEMNVKRKKSNILSSVV